MKITKGKRVFLHSEDPLVFELGPQTNAFYHHPDVSFTIMSTLRAVR